MADIFVNKKKKNRHIDYRTIRCRTELIDDIIKPYIVRDDTGLKLVLTYK